MRITYLGTAASEGFPAVFCNCRYCKEAKKLKGKNIRTRSQVIINDDLLIDLPPDTYSHFLNNDIDADKIKYLFVTHSHTDHFYPEELCMRRSVFAHDMRCETLKMYCSAGAAVKVEKVPAMENSMTDFSVIHPFDTVCEGDYIVTALPARHAEGDGAIFYIVKQGEKTILYAHDTGYFYDEVFEYIKGSGLRFDLISFDCTNIDIPISDEGNHMGVDNIEKVAMRLEEMGAADEKTIKVISHFSHNANPLHHVVEERVRDLGYVVAYDGMNIEI